MTIKIIWGGPSLSSITGWISAGDDQKEAFLNIGIWTLEYILQGGPSGSVIMHLDVKMDVYRQTFNNTHELSILFFVLKAVSTPLPPNLIFFL